MTETIVIILISAAAFLTFVLYLALDQENLEKWTSLSFTIAIVGGLCIYGLINAYDSDIPPVAILRTVTDLGRMFGGVNRFDVYAKIVNGNTFWLIFFWIVHFFAYYSLVSAVVLLLGKDVVRKIRTLLLMVRDVELIYGVDANSIAYGRHLAENRHISVVFVNGEASAEGDVRHLGGVLYCDEAAVKAQKKFIKRLRIKKGKGSIRLNALSANSDENMRYALALMKSLELMEIDPSQISLVLLGREQESGAALQATADHYGYGSVTVYERAELAARLMMRQYPICDAIRFDENGKATEDVEILQVGFGRIGQAMLRKLVANGQFEGSHFHVQVFDPMIGRVDGLFRLRFDSMLKNYDITLDPHDGRSIDATEYIRNKATSIKYVTVATSDEKTGREIAHNLIDILNLAGVNLPVYQCCSDRVIAYLSGSETSKQSIYDSDILRTGKLDEVAVQLNHYYCGEDGSAADQWAACDYFSRMSCRASADFLQTLFKRLGFKGGDTLPEEMMENLGRTEHHRWCAFHYSMGYSSMSREVQKQRALLREKDPSIRVTKDTKLKLHACLVPWEELDELSEFESTVTGKKPDYKKMDKDNVQVIYNLINK